METNMTIELKTLKKYIIIKLHGFERMLRVIIFIKKNKKYEAAIKVGGDKINLGYFKNESDAKNAYLYAKGIVHSD